MTPKCVDPNVFAAFALCVPKNRAFYSSNIITTYIIKTITTRQCFTGVILPTSVTVKMNDNTRNEW
jgi:hypothetical protein